MADVMKELQLKARDHGRLPMQWNDGPNAGFTVPDTGPWMTVNPDYKPGWNVETQQDDPNSVLSFWRESLAFRKKFVDVFSYGSFEMLPESATHEKVVAYKRKDYGTDKEALLLNFSDQNSTVTIPWVTGWSVLRGNYSTSPSRGEKIVLRPYEAVIYCSGFSI